MTRAFLRFGWYLAALVACLFTFLIGNFFAENLDRPLLLDFLSYWAAVKLAGAGNPALAYDLGALAAMQGQVVETVDGIMPFPYPPTFLLLLMPFAALPYFPALACWLLATGGWYLSTARRFAPWPWAAAQPAVLINGLIGQNGFLLAGIFMAGASRLAERPFLAGAILGTLVIKPQLALLLPVAVVASRSWAAIPGAMLSAGGLSLAALLAFGPESYAAFFRMLSQYAAWMAADRFAWNEFASPFAFVRFLGGSAGLAMAVQACCLGVAVLACWTAWRRQWDERVVVLCAASLLGSPYLQAYDTLLMLVPIGWWLERRPALSALLWLLCFAPIAIHLGWWSGPDTTPLAALLTLGLVARARLQKVEPVMARIRPSLA